MCICTFMGDIQLGITKRDRSGGEYRDEIMDTAGRGIGACVGD